MSSQNAWLKNLRGWCPSVPKSYLETEAPLFKGSCVISFTHENISGLKTAEILCEGESFANLKELFGWWVQYGSNICRRQSYWQRPLCSPANLLAHTWELDWTTLPQSWNWRALAAATLPYSLIQFSSITRSCPTVCNPMNRSIPGLPVHHQLLEFTQTHVHRVSDAIQPSHPLSSPSPPAPQSLPAWGSFPMSQLFVWSCQRIGVSASASVLQMNT